MIDLLSKPIGEIGFADVQALIDSEVPEGEQIEFKRELPGEGGRPDPWMDNGKLGSYAKDRILREVVAFANAYGDVLVLGIDESDEKPAVATEITRIPRCADLAESLKLVFRDRVEPQLARIDIAGIPTRGDGSGVVVICVGNAGFVRNDGGLWLPGHQMPPKLPNAKFPTYPLNEPDAISDLLGWLNRDFWNAMEEDVGETGFTLK